MNDKMTFEEALAILRKFALGVDEVYGFRGSSEEERKLYDYAVKELKKIDRAAKEDD